MVKAILLEIGIFNYNWFFYHGLKLVINFYQVYYKLNYHLDLHWNSFKNNFIFKLFLAIIDLETLFYL